MSRGTSGRDAASARRETSYDPLRIPLDAPLTLGQRTRPMSSLVCKNPATGEVMGEAAIMGLPEVTEIVRAARKAQVAWATTTFEERKRVLRRLLDAIVRDQARIARLAVRDSGKTMVDAAMGEV